MCLFAFYAFVFLLIEITVNNRAAVLWGQDKVIFVYAVGLLFTAAGYISFTFSQRWQTGERGRKLLEGIIYNALVQETCSSKFLHLSAFQRSGGYARRLFTP